MAFDLHIPDTERAYLDNLPLSAEAKERINQFIENFIANVADDFRLNPENRPSPGAPYFLVQHLLFDIWGDRCMHTIDFYIRDDQAAVGVLLVVFIDHHQGHRLPTH